MKPTIEHLEADGNAIKAKKKCIEWELKLHLFYIQNVVKLPIRIKSMPLFLKQ